MFNPFKRLPAEQVDEFARALAEDFVRRYPLATHEVGAAKADKALGKALENVCRRGREFNVEHRLRFYDKARLGNTFQWELRERGFPEDFADEVTKAFIVEIGRSPAS